MSRSKYHGEIFYRGWLQSSWDISFKNIFSTKMYCEEVQQTEDLFLKLLGKVTSFKLKNKTLLLFQDKELLIEFVSE